WRRPGGDIEPHTPFSPDGRYFIYANTVWDAVNGWPIFRFHQQSDIAIFHWSGDTVTVFEPGSEYDNTAGKAVEFRASDILPEKCSPHDLDVLHCVVGGVP